MRKLFLTLLSGAIGLGAIWGADWASQSGNAQRDGWAQGEAELVKGNIQALRLLYKTKLDNESVGPDALTSPIILGNLITYRGFKEMLFVGGSSDNVYSIDAALNQQLWKTHFDGQADAPKASATSVCPGGMTASIAIVGGSSPMERAFHFRRRARSAGPGVGPGQGGAAHKPAPVPDRPAQSSALFAKGFGSNGYVFAIGSDGYLRFVRQSDGNDTAIAPVKFVPPNSRVTSINVSGTRVYAATIDGCGGHPNALYAVDLGGSDRTVRVFPTNGSGPSGLGGTAAAADGTVYAQVRDGHGTVAGKYNDTVVALDPEELKVNDYFTPAGNSSASSERHGFLGVTPAVFQWKGREVVIAGGRDGSLYLLDGASLGGHDHHTPLCRTKPIQAADGNSSARGIWGDFSTWEDAGTQTRWVYAALWGPTRAGANISETNGPAANGNIVAFKVEDRNGQPALVPQWKSRDLMAPASPVTTNGLVFALSTGQSPGPETPAGHATMYVLDGTTGKELFSSGDDAAGFSHGSGLAIANGRVYFTTHDNTVYCYGLPAMQPQLTDR
jgi:outer membrane protein assembly factor BamB